MLRSDLTAGTEYFVLQGLCLSSDTAQRKGSEQVNSGTVVPLSFFLLETPFKKK